MKKIVIVVEDGRITNAYSNEEIDIEIIDFDTVDPDEYEEALNRLKEVDTDSEFSVREVF